MRGWLETLPDEVIQVRPVLSVDFAGALLSDGEFEGVEARLRDAERWLDAADGSPRGTAAAPAGMVVADEEEYRRLPGAIEIYRAAAGAGPGRAARRRSARPAGA